MKTLNDAIELWYKIHGHTLKDAKYRFSRTLAISDRMGNPQLSDFTARDFAEYRATRAGDVSNSTLNHELRYMRSVFNELIRLDYLSDNPLENVRQFTVSESELSYLDSYQIDSLFDSLKKSRNKDVYWVARLALNTGARWIEAETISKRHIQRVPTPGFKYHNTKNGKTRFVPVTQSFMSEFLAHVSPGKDGSLFSSSRSAFRSAVSRAGIELPPQQLTHVLRHTFASQFMMAGGDIFILQRLLGHSDIKTTMRYLHFSPVYMKDAPTLAPDTKVAFSSIVKM